MIDFTPFIKGVLDLVSKKRNDTIKLVGEVTIEVRDKNGKLKFKRTFKNVITNVGKAQVAGLINGVVTTPFKYIAIGTGDPDNPGTCSSESASDTSLQNEVARTQATVSRTTTNVTNDTAQLQATFTAGATWKVCESGVFDASSGGNMLARKTFDTVTLYSGDQIAITWKITVS